MTKSELAAVKESWMELVSSVQQMCPSDDKIICDHVKRAEGLLRAIVLMEGDVQDWRNAPLRYRLLRESREVCDD